MKNNELIINIQGLKEGGHDFDFEISDKFFDQFESSLISKGNFKVDVHMTKRTTFLELNILIKGNAITECDRCLEDLSIALFYEGDLYVRLKEMEESDISDDDDVMFLPPETDLLDLSQHIYESLALSLPSKRVHPDDDEGYSTCNPEMLEKLDQATFTTKEEETIDPRWEALMKLKDKK